jgi:hypothetical protein
VGSGDIFIALAGTEWGYGTITECLEMTICDRSN